jgi:hypothetical protein
MPTERDAPITPQPSTGEVVMLIACILIIAIASFGAWAAGQ